jgi:hypothetical protein
MKKVICGLIKAATEVQQFDKKNGQSNVKCILHIVAVGDEPYPEELAVTVCGQLTLYAAAVGSAVEVEYIVRVFPFEKKGKTMYGNDVYATAIQPWQP